MRLFIGLIPSIYLLKRAVRGFEIVDLATGLCELQVG
jgi:hypothetical protein